MYSSRMKSFSVLLLLSLLGLGGCGDPKSDPPAEAVRNFYTWRIEAQRNGFPTSAEIEQMAPYLSNELQALLMEASADYSPSQAPTKNERTIEHGDWFTSMFDGPTSFIVGEVQSTGTQARCLGAIHLCEAITCGELARSDSRHRRRRSSCDCERGVRESLGLQERCDVDRRIEGSEGSAETAELNEARNTCRRGPEGVR